MYRVRLYRVIRNVRGDYPRLVIFSSFSLEEMSAILFENASRDLDETWHRGRLPTRDLQRSCRIFEMAAISKWRPFEILAGKLNFVRSAWNRVIWVNRVSWARIRKRKFPPISGFFLEMAAENDKIAKNGPQKWKKFPSCPISAKIGF